jgi:hypothetical protein
VCESGRLPRWHEIRVARSERFASPGYSQVTGPDEER